MKKCLLFAGLVVLALGQVAGVAQAQDQPPAPPAGQPQPGAQPSAPGTTHGESRARSARCAAGRAHGDGLSVRHCGDGFPKVTVNLPQLGRAVAQAVRDGLERSRTYSSVMFDPDSDPDPAGAG